jgi:hypothetical protein
MAPQRLGGQDELPRMILGERVRILTAMRGGDPELFAFDDRDVVAKPDKVPELATRRRLWRTTETAWPSQPTEISNISS